MTTRTTLMILSTSALVALGPLAALAQSDASSPVAADTEATAETNEATAAEEQTERLLEDAETPEVAGPDQTPQTGTTEMAQDSVTDETGDPAGEDGEAAQTGGATAESDVTPEGGVVLPTQDGTSGGAAVAGSSPDGGDNDGSGMADGSQSVEGEVLDQGVTLPGGDGADGGSDGGSGDMQMQGGAMQPGQGNTDMAQSPQIGMERGATAPGDMSSGQPMMLDVESFAQSIYERAYAEGYMEGVADARRQVLQELRARRQQAMREEMMQQQRRAGDRAMRQQSQRPMPQPQRRQAGGSDGSGQGQPQGGQTRSAPEQAQTSGMAAQSSGSIIVLPQGMTVDEFIDQVRSSNR